MKYNTKVQVRDTHLFHPNRIGYFRFLGRGPSQGTVVLATEPRGNPTTLFAVDIQDIKTV